MCRVSGEVFERVGLAVGALLMGLPGPTEAVGVFGRGRDRADAYAAKVVTTKL